MLALAVCAQAGSTRLSPEYQVRYDAVETCIGWRVLEPRIAFRRSELRLHAGIDRWCMAKYEECVGGTAYPWDRLIELTDIDATLMEHESVHYVLYLIGDPGWNDHSHPAFAKCGQRGT